MSSEEAKSLLIDLLDKNYEVGLKLLSSESWAVMENLSVENAAKKIENYFKLSRAEKFFIANFFGILTFQQTQKIFHSF